MNVAETYFLVKNNLVISDRKVILCCISEKFSISCYFVIGISTAHSS